MDPKVEDTHWMLLSPHMLARAHHDAFYVSYGRAPELGELGQSLLDTHNLAIPPHILEKWMKQFQNKH